jgi:hypothetical protein
LQKQQKLPQVVLETFYLQLVFTTTRMSTKFLIGPKL